MCHATPLRDMAQKASQLVATLGLSALMAGVRLWTMLCVQLSMQPVAIASS